MKAAKISLTNREKRALKKHKCELVEVSKNEIFLRGREGTLYPGYRGIEVRTTEVEKERLKRLCRKAKSLKLSIKGRHLVFEVANGKRRYITFMFSDD